jgi:hypothetical protein
MANAPQDRGAKSWICQADAYRLAGLRIFCPVLLVKEVLFSHIKKPKINTAHLNPFKTIYEEI